MPDVSKRILTDETGQDIVTALTALTNVVDPNGTAVAAAAKINNMTVAATALPVSASITATISEVSNHKHIEFGIPTILPTVTSSNNGQILKVSNGIWDVGVAPVELPSVSSTDNGKILQVDNGVWAAMTALPTTMTGCSASADGAGGLVPQPVAGNQDQFLSGDGTWKSGGLPMVILSYGNSTWSDFINAYNNNVIVYCRASSNANPKTGAQTRMAFMAYVNDATTPTNVEFQYYRSMNPSNKTISQMSDQVYVYKLTSAGVWSVEVREASLKSIVFDASSGLTGTFDKTTGTLTIAAAT